MRSLFEKHTPALQQEIAKFGTQLSSQDIHRMAHQHRAMMIGNVISDAIIWLINVPQRLLSWATASVPHYVQPWRS